MFLKWYTHRFDNVQIIEASFTALCRAGIFSIEMFVLFYRQGFVIGDVKIAVAYTVKCCGTFSGSYRTLQEGVNSTMAQRAFRPLKVYWCPNQKRENSDNIPKYGLMQTLCALQKSSRVIWTLWWLRMRAALRIKQAFDFRLFWDMRYTSLGSDYPVAALD